MTTATSFAWLDEAWRHLGVAEISGARSDPRILAFYRDAGHAAIRSDAIAWCAAFVGACLARSDHAPSGSLLARSYLKWGEPIDEPRYGALAVFTRGANPAHGHVGFLVGHVDDDLIVLGGNQDDAVTVAAYPRSRLLSIRWPSDSEASPSPPLFETVIAHVLDMEGGYTDDPHDPGGPTNRGITLATFAKWRSATVTPETFAMLKAELRALDRATAIAIYKSRYWSQSRAGDLPTALALMHFDASVNHGITGAAKLLQQALDIEIDGEVGPDTISAVGNQQLETLIARYADARVAKYRSLPHFWRFGRGWLNRVTKTRAAALALLTTHPSSSQTSEKDTAMTTIPSDVAPKWWGNSLTIWGTFLTALTTVLPAIAPLFGLDLTGEMIVSFGHAITALLQAIGGVAGTIMAIYGRIRATQPLVRRPLSLRL